MRLEYFQMIDRIVRLDLDGKTITAHAQIPEISPVFEGHFPGHPLMPGVLLIEAMAQTSGWLMIALTNFDRMPFLAAVKTAKLRTFVTPGQLLSLTSTLIHEGSGYAMVKCGAAVGDKPVADSEITLRVMPFPNPGFRASMTKTAIRIGFPAKVPADD